MPDDNLALPGADPAPVDTAIDNPTDPAVDPAAPAASADSSDKGGDPEPADPNAGLHPDALDPTDPNKIPDLTKEEMADPSRLQTRFKDLTTKANKATDLEAQNEQLLRDNEELRALSKDPNDPEPAASKDPEKYTPEQLAQAKSLMDELGYVPKEDVETLNKTVQKLSKQQATESDNRMMNEAIENYTDKEGNPIVSERHIKNAMRKWLASDNPQVRQRVHMDYDAIIQLIGGSKLNKTVTKKKPSPKVPSGGGEPAYKPEVAETLYDPGNPIGSKEAIFSRILNSLE